MWGVKMLTQGCHLPRHLWGWAGGCGAVSGQGEERGAAGWDPQPAPKGGGSHIAPSPSRGLPVPPGCTCPLWPCRPGAASLRGPLAAAQSRLSRALQPRRPCRAGPVGTQPALFNRARLLGPRAAGVLWGGDGSAVLCFPRPHARLGLFLWEQGRPHPAGCSPGHGSFSSGKMKAGGAAEIRGMSLGVGEIRS